MSSRRNIDKGAELRAAAREMKRRAGCQKPNWSALLHPSTPGRRPGAKLKGGPRR